MSQSIDTILSKNAELGERERQFASILWRHQMPDGAGTHNLSRNTLHELTGVHKTLAGYAVRRLLDSKLIREGAPEVSAERGRPMIPLQINPDGPAFVGVSIEPGEVRLCTLTPAGLVRAVETVRKHARDSSLIQLAAEMLDGAIKSDVSSTGVFSIGVAVTGVVDPHRREMLFSSASPSASPISLEAIYKAAGDTPVFLDNDVHALSSRWLLNTDTNDDCDGDVLLVGLDDGRLGASLLIDHKPHRGSVTAANELGHMRLAIDTDLCFCGQTGCLERIVSTPQLTRFNAKTSRTLDEVLADPAQDERAITTLLDHLTTGLANAINFVRPARLVIASPLVRHKALTDYLHANLPPRILPGIRSRVRTSFWQQSCVQSAENAAWLALADVFGRPSPTKNS